MESSQFTDSQPQFESLESLEVQGATCDTFRVKLYGKLHFLKRLKLEYANDIRYQEAFHKEFETGYRLEHPNLVRYISLSDKGILMEYVDGETLAQRLDSQPEYFKKRKNADKFVSQLLDVVGYLHSHQVLHLDLKPDNILLTRINNDVKLIDFGCCYTDTFPDTQGHTNRFAAPEQLSGGEVDARTDIYAIGRILELLPSSIYNKVIVRCTSPDKTDRFQSVEEIRQDNMRRNMSIYYAMAATAILAVALSAFLYSQCSVLNEGREVLKDSVLTSESIQNPPVEVIPSSSATNQQLPANINVQQIPSESKSDIKLMKKDMEKMIDKAYRSTISSLCDSVFPSPSVGRLWSEASTEFHHQTKQIGDQLVVKYPSISESVIRQEAEARFQSLVGYVFNKMRENGMANNDEVH